MLKQIFYSLLVLLNQLNLTTSILNKGLLIIDPFIDFIHSKVKDYCEDNQIELFEAVSGYTNAILTASGDEK